MPLPSRAPFHLLLCLSLVLVSVLSISAVQVQTIPTASAENNAEASDWSVAIGSAIYMSLKHPGARSGPVFPWIDQEIEYQHRFFSKGMDFTGVYPVNDDIRQVGGNFQFDLTWRHVHDDARLNDLGNVNATVHVRALAQYTASFLTLSIDAEQDILGNRQGLTANADAYASTLVGRWLLSLGTDVSWTNSQYMRSFFGVDDDQSARPSLPVFATYAGLCDIHFNTIVTYKLDDRRTTSSSFTVARPRDDAANSPITQRRQQTTATASLTYRFH